MEKKLNINDILNMPAGTKFFMLSGYRILDFVFVAKSPKSNSVVVLNGDNYGAASVIRLADNEEIWIDYKIARIAYCEYLRTKVERTIAIYSSEP